VTRYSVSCTYHSGVPRSPYRCCKYCLFVKLGIKATVIIINAYQSTDGLTNDNREFALVEDDLNQHLPTILGEVATPSDPQLQSLVSECIALATALKNKIKSFTDPRVEQKP
jgi:hypothetical protein